MKIGEIIKTKRLEKGYSQKQLSDLSGISLSSIQKGENGIRNLKLDSLLKIANTLECDINDLLGYKYTPEDIDFLDGYKESDDLKKFIEVMEYFGYEFRDNGGNYKIFKSDKTDLDIPHNEINNFSEKVSEAISDFLEITLKHIIR